MIGYIKRCRAPKHNAKVCRRAGDELLVLGHLDQQELVPSVASAVAELMKDPYLPTELITRREIYCML